MACCRLRHDAGVRVSERLAIGVGDRNGRGDMRARRVHVGWYRLCHSRSTCYPRSHGAVVLGVTPGRWPAPGHGGVVTARRMLPDVGWDVLHDGSWFPWEHGAVCGSRAHYGVPVNPAWILNGSRVRSHPLPPYSAYLPTKIHVHRRGFFLFFFLSFFLSHETSSACIPCSDPTRAPVTSRY